MILYDLNLNVYINFTSTKYTPWKMNGWFTSAITHEKRGTGTWSEPNNLQITHIERKRIFQTKMIMVHVNLPGCMFKFNLPDCLFVLNDSISKQKRPQFLDQKSPFLSLASNDLSKPKRLDAPVTYGRSKHFHMFHGETVVQIGNYLETKLQDMCFFLEVGTWSWNGGCENRALYC